MFEGYCLERSMKKSSQVLKVFYGFFCQDSLNKTCNVYAFYVNYTSIKNNKEKNKN